MKPAPPMAALQTAADFDAFMGGVQLGIGAALLVVALLGALAIVRRIIGA